MFIIALSTYFHSSSLSNWVISYHLYLILPEGGDISLYSTVPDICSGTLLHTGSLNLVTSRYTGIQNVPEFVCSLCVNSVCAPTQCCWLCFCSVSRLMRTSGGVHMLRVLTRREKCTVGIIERESLWSALQWQWSVASNNRSILQHSPGVRRFVRTARAAQSFHARRQSDRIQKSSTNPHRRHPL